MTTQGFGRVKTEFQWAIYVQEHHAVKPTPSAELRINCPSCHDDKYKLYVNPDKGVFHCFKCTFSSKHNDVFDFVALTEGITRYQAIHQLVREYSRVTPDDEDVPGMLQATSEEVAPKVSIKTLSGMPAGLKKLTERTEEGADFWDYLISRGITPAEIRALGTMYTPEFTLPVIDSKGKRRGDLADRVVFPVYGGKHELVSWQSRTIDPNYARGDKYMAAPESEMAKTVWPYVPPYGKHVVIVEGIFDCLAVRRIPEVSAYATFSKKISLEQMQCLQRWGVEEVTLFWDKKDAKREMIDAIPDLLMMFKRVYVCNMTDWPANVDAGNMLADPQGTDKLKKALADRVDTYDTLEFTTWKLKF